MEPELKKLAQSRARYGLYSPFAQQGDKEAQKQQDAAIAEGGAALTRLRELNETYGNVLSEKSIIEIADRGLAAGFQRAAEIRAEAARHEADKSWLRKACETGWSALVGTLEATWDLTAGNLAQGAGLVAGLFNGRGATETATDWGVATINAARHVANNYGPGSVLGTDHQLAQMSGVQVVMAVNPLVQAGRVLQPVFDAADALYDNYCMKVYGLDSREELIALRERDPALRWGKRAFQVSEICFAGAITGASASAGTQGAAVAKALGTAAAFGAGSAVAQEAYQYYTPTKPGEESRTFSLERVADHTLGGTAQMMTFAAGLSVMQKAYVRVRFGGDIPADLSKLSTAELTRLNKALVEVKSLSGGVDTVVVTGMLSDSTAALADSKNFGMALAGMAQFGIAAYGTHQTFRQVSKPYARRAAETSRAIAERAGRVEGPELPEANRPGEGAGVTPPAARPGQNAPLPQEGSPANGSGADGAPRQAAQGPGAATAPAGSPDAVNPAPAQGANPGAGPQIPPTPQANGIPQTNGTTPQSAPPVVLPPALTRPVRIEGPMPQAGRPVGELHTVEIGGERYESVYVKSTPARGAVVYVEPAAIEAFGRQLTGRSDYRLEGFHYRGADPVVDAFLKQLNPKLANEPSVMVVPRGPEMGAKAAHEFGHDQGLDEAGARARENDYRRRNGLPPIPESNPAGIRLPDRMAASGMVREANPEGGRLEERYRDFIPGAICSRDWIRARGAAVEGLEQGVDLWVPREVLRELAPTALEFFPNGMPIQIKSSPEGAIGFVNEGINRRQIIPLLVGPPPRDMTPRQLLLKLAQDGMHMPKYRERGEGAVRLERMFENIIEQMFEGRLEYAFTDRLPEWVQNQQQGRFTEPSRQFNNSRR